jgi:tRNA pseudouridine13 synthase
MHLPYITADLPGIGGQIKTMPEDFFVQEIPLYEPAGEGEHVYVEIQKTGMTTFDAVNRIAFELNIPRQNIGFAGMKDANAVTRQTFSIQGANEEAIQALKIDDLQILSAVRHGNKLRLGHLKGNRFAIRLRQIESTDVVKVQPIIDVIRKRGLPNFFGEQRFGTRHNNDLLGAALIRDDNMGLLKLLLGTPDAKYDDAQSSYARRLFDEHKNEESLHQWPRRCGLERRVLHRLIKSHKPSAAVRMIDEPLKRLWVSALQSRVFNEVLSRRLQSFDRILPGDFAWKHENGACFLVEDAAAEQARAEAFDISPTGPLLGYRMSTPEGEPLKIEEEVLQQFQLAPQQFRLEGKHKVKGARRPLRVKVEDLVLEGGVDDHGAFVTLAFTLPAGAFATTLLREVMKSVEEPTHNVSGPLPEPPAEATEEP